MKTTTNLPDILKPWDFLVIYGHVVCLFRPRHGVIPISIYSANSEGNPILSCGREDIATGYDTLDNALKAIGESILCNLVRIEGQVIKGSREVMYQFQPIK